MSLTHPSAGLTSIVAVGLSGEIGINNGLPWRLKSDLRFFKETTLNNIIIMGRKTYESIGGCLPKRENLVLSHRPTLFQDHDGCHHTHSIGETLWRRTKYPKKQAFVIGGAQTYEQFAPFVSRYLITVVQSHFPEADAFFNERVLDDSTAWVRTELKVDRVAGDNADEFDFSIFELRHPYPDQVAMACSREIAAFEERNHLIRRKELRREAARSQALDQVRSIA